MLGSRRLTAPFARLRRSRWRSFLDLVLAAAILGLLILLAARLDRVETHTLTGRPMVNDGDTITLGTERIRLRGLDAPELGQICRRNDADYACGRRAREALAILIGEHPVACSGWERDRYGRLLATCSVVGRDINSNLVERGWAVAYGDFEIEEQRARASRSGLWAGTFERPRDWRTQHGGMAESEHNAMALIVNWLSQLLR